MQEETLAIILNYNSKLDTALLVNQLHAMTNSDILVVDNASVADNFGEFDELGRITLIYSSKNLGYSGGNNIGLRYSVEKGYKYSWILNPDITINKNTLGLLIKGINTDEKLAAIGPRILETLESQVIYSDGGIIDFNTWKTDHRNQGKQIKELEPLSEPTSVDFVNGSCILIKNDALKEIGLFYEKFFMYYEETDWCCRAIQKGFKIAAVTEAKVIHRRSEKGKLFHYYLTRNRSLISKIHADGIQAKVILIDRLLEYKNFIFTGKKRPFVFERLKGAISGYFTSIKDYKTSVALELKKFKS